MELVVAGDLLDQRAVVVRDVFLVGLQLG